MSSSRAQQKNNWIAFALLGIAVGLASGLFGVGGGIIIVPILTYLLGFDIKKASGTSLLAVIVPAITGVISYAIGGHVHVLIALLLAAGSVVGAPIGSRLLERLSEKAVQWVFIVFLSAVIVSLFLVIPSREAEVDVTIASGVLLVVCGLFAGIAGGLLGLGGGIIVVPMMIVLFGVSDLMAKGTSLLMIIATGLSGTVSNVRRGNVDIRAALVIGICGAAVTPFSVHLSEALDPLTANIVFSCFVAAVIVRMLVAVWPRKSRS